MIILELWIRSQDKMEFAKIEDIFISQDKINRIIGYSHGIKCFLGDYETHERALEVLDEIQDLMRSLTDSDLKIIQYEMPED